MSKGPGRVERAIIAAFKAEPDRAFTTEELALAVYAGLNRAEKKHRVAVLRAMRRLRSGHPEMGEFRSETLGGQAVYFNRTSVTSYAMARAKADRLWGYATADARRLNCWKRSESALHSELAEGGRYHKRVVAGGAWWQHVEWWKAEIEASRSGDDERLGEIHAEVEAWNGRIDRQLRVISAAISSSRPSTSRN
jgi:hypothetical protein